MLKIFGITLVCLFAACTASKKIANEYPAFFKEGHRGTRGLMPENTIPAMKKGLEVGAAFIEVDVYLTKDKKVMISHDPYLNVSHSLTEDGKEVSKEDAKKYVWHQMNYEDIRKFDVGSKDYPLFPQQQRVRTYMPLLDELIDSVEAYTTANKMAGAVYNIELKTSRQYDTLQYNSSPEELVRTVMAIVKAKNLGKRYYLQSFDERPLQYLHQSFPGVTIGYLTSGKDFKRNMSLLGFVPEIYSPEYHLVDRALVASVHEKKMKLVPWTVNDTAKMKELIGMGVDGIITDYPNYFKEIGK